ncbi:ML domain-containing protein [Powellomyces hirtus]|nr:ML domain-containing protein [Powellomyces hirtus]
MHFKALPIVLSVFASLAAAAPAPLADEVAFEACPNKPTGFLTLTGAEIVPLPVVAGQNVTISLQGTTDRDIVQGAKAVVKVGLIPGFPLYTFDLDICEQAPKQGLACPIAPGAQSISATREVPAVPAGTYSVTIDATNGDGEAITCVQGSLPVARA